MKAKERRLNELKNRIAEVTPEQAQRLLGNGAVLIDVREDDEVAQGSPPGALRISKGYLELRIEDAVPDTGRPLLVMCAAGARSLFAAEALLQMGYQDVRSVAGGFNRWKNEGLPFEMPRLLDEQRKKRYSRHLLLSEVGVEGQLKLLDSKVLLVGAGGLGSPAALYLAAAGVGTLGLVDHDVVDRSNLQRQVLHTDERVGVSKVASARDTLTALNPDVNIMGFETHLNRDNVDEILSQFDLVLDGSDNLPTRYLLNDACVKLGLPNVHGAVYRFEGQLTVFWPGHSQHEGGCYRCMFPQPPPPAAAPSCSEIGVLGVLPGVIGLLQAVEVIKLLLGIGTPLIGKILYFDALAARFSEFKAPRRAQCPVCGDHVQAIEYQDYEQICATPGGGS